MNHVEGPPVELLVRIDGADVEVGGLLEDLCRETTNLVQIVRAQDQEIADLRATLARRERTITGLEEWIKDAREALQRAEELERALDGPEGLSASPPLLD